MRGIPIRIQYKMVLKRSQMINNQFIVHLPMGPAQLEPIWRFLISDASHFEPAQVFILH